MIAERLYSSGGCCVRDDEIAQTGLAAAAEGGDMRGDRVMGIHLRWVTLRCACPYSIALHPPLPVGQRPIFVSGFALQTVRN